MARLDADPGGHAVALEKLVGTPVARLPLHDDIHLCCDRDGLLFGLALARRAVATAHAEPWRSEITLRFEGRVAALDTGEWPVGADYLLARAAADGALVDLTAADIRQWMFWLGLDYILHR